MDKASYFSVDALTQRDNLFTRMDARIKMLFCIASVIMVFAIPGLKFTLWLFGTIAAVLFFTRIPLKLVAGRIIAPVFLGSFVFLLLLFFQGGTPLFTLNIFGFNLNGYREGFTIGAMIMARTAASVSILLFLSVTTPIHEIGYALMYFKFPKVIVEILLLTYRYLFVLWDEGMRIRHAQDLRLGYSGGRGVSCWKRKIKSVSTLMAMVFIRAFDRAESTFNAMQVRAYNGNVSGRHYKSWNSRGTQPWS